MVTKVSLWEKSSVESSALRGAQRTRRRWYESHSPSGELRVASRGSPTLRQEGEGAVLNWGQGDGMQDLSFCLILGSPLLEPREKRGTPGFYNVNARINDGVKRESWATRHARHHRETSFTAQST